MKKLDIFELFKKSEKINNEKKSEKIKLFERFAQQTQRPPT